MPKRKLTDTFTYRHRFVLVYVIGTLLVAFLFARALYLLSGITSAEMASSIAAMSLDGLGIDAPYHALQSVSLRLFGLTSLGIKAPSVLLAAVTVIALFLLVSRWTRRSTGSAAALVFGASTAPLTFAATGSPAILYVFYPVTLLLLGTHVIQKSRRRYAALLGLLVVIGLALLTPGMLYIIAAGAVVGLLTPHIRHGLRNLGLVGGVALAIGGLAAVAPVIIASITEPARIAALLLAGPAIDTGVLLAHTGRVASLFFGFFTPGFNGSLPTPLLGLASFGLGMIGLVVILRTLYTARSRFLATWLVVALVMAIVSPTVVPLVYTVLVLLIGVALDWIARYWFRLFPLNPYARLFGLGLIIILVGGVVLSNVLRFVGTAEYAVGSRALYSRDLSLVTATDRDENGAPMILLVRESDKRFYEGLTAEHPNISVVGRLPRMTPGTYVLSASALDGLTATRIITDSRAVGSDRFYLYK